MRLLVITCFVLMIPSLAVARPRPRRAQSAGAPWNGTLHHATRLPDNDTQYHLRRPWRAFGTRTTVARIERAIAAVRRTFPKAHVLAIGDLSAERGGAISGHRSHQSGRDVDLGLFYKVVPANYPRDFVSATAGNLDCAATFALIEQLAATSGDADGVQVMFLDFGVQELVYRWARGRGTSERRLARLFQYPHGRGASGGLVRHIANHDDHLHVRFKCPSGATSCR
ncbi:MAG: penicillin-insensitive murein endopeptidase [Deltaproteobacteria bacterium]|nr:penicillin-insensitive murein endopeptidase [Deltaproteobacteria bacterium]